MHLRCPHCMNAVEIVEDRDWWEVTCPSCGTHISVADDEETRTHMPAEEKLAHFELLERIGMGHFGVVWRARDTVLDRVVALKVSRERTDAKESRWSFLREAKAASQLKHPNIIPIYEIGRAAGRAFIVSEYIEGTDLRRHLKRRGKMKPQQAARIASGIARALHHAHRHGVLHRDVKSGNILLKDDQHPYLADFGLAKRDVGEVAMTRDGEILGTPAYMPPEQAAGRNSEVDARSDIYSLGAVLYEMLTGQLLFQGGEHTLIYQVIYEDPPTPRRASRDVPDDLATICLKCLEKDPADRYQCAGELADELDRFLQGDSIHARKPSIARRAVRWCRRDPARTLAAVATTAAFFLLGVIAWANARWRADDLSIFPPWVEDKVHVVVPTTPERAHLVFVPIDPTTFEERPRYRLGPFDAGTAIELPSGWYLVIAYVDDTLFNEVYRLVPRPGERQPFLSIQTVFRQRASGEYELSPIRLFSQDEVTRSGMAVVTRSTIGRGGRVTVPSFYCDLTEFTYRDIERNGLPPTVYQQTASGRSLELDLPVTRVHWFRALELAERLGKRLPLTAEYESLLQRARQPLRPPPNATSSLRPVTKLEEDAIPVGRQAIFGLRSNADEWLLGPASRTTSHRRRTASAHGTRPVWHHNTSDAPDDAEPEAGRPRPEDAPAIFSAAWLGFRGVRSSRPRLTPRDFVQSDGR